MSIFSILLNSTKPPPVNNKFSDQTQEKNTSSNTSSTSSRTNSSNSSPSTPRRKFTFIDILSTQAGEKSTSKYVKDDIETTFSSNVPSPTCQTSSSNSSPSTSRRKFTFIDLTTQATEKTTSKPTEDDMEIDQAEERLLTPEQNTLFKVIKITNKQDWYDSTHINLQNPFESLQMLFSNQECVKEVSKAYRSYAEKLINYINNQQVFLKRFQLITSSDLEQQEVLINNLSKISNEAPLYDLKTFIELITHLKNIMNWNQENIDQMSEPIPIMDEFDGYLIKTFER